MAELIEKELSYQIMGCAFRVFKGVGYGYREKYYQRALAEEFSLDNLRFKRECLVKLIYRNKIIGRYYIDFVVNDRVIVELKIAKDFYVRDVKQVLSYLKAKDLRLGILIIITKDGMKFKRIVN
jgi:GxxExxY protein